MTTKNIQPIEDFNWDALGKKENSFDGVSREELEKKYGETFSQIQEGTVVDGTIVAINKREVVVNIGYKSEGVINAAEFRYETDIKVGDKVEVFVESMETANGQLLLSHKKAQSLKSWDRVNEACNNDEIVKGYIKCRTKGGMIVDVFGIEAFLPGSQIDVKPIRDYDVFVGKTMELKVVKINDEFKNVVVSHKALIEAELEEQKKQIISKLEKGQVLEGTVKNITSYGYLSTWAVLTVSSTSPTCRGDALLIRKKSFSWIRRFRLLSSTSTMTRSALLSVSSNSLLIHGILSIQISRLVTRLKVKSLLLPTTVHSSRLLRA